MGKTPQIELAEFTLNSENVKKTIKGLAQYMAKSFSSVVIPVNIDDQDARKEVKKTEKKLEKTKINLKAEIDEKTLRDSAKKSGKKAGKELSESTNKEIRKDKKSFEKTGLAVGKQFNKGFAKSSSKLGDTLKGAFAGAGAFALLQTGLRAASTGLKSAVTNATEFKSSMADLSAITGLQGEALEEFGQKARDLSSEFGTSTTDQIESFKAVISRFGPDIAGSPEAVDSMSRSINTLAKAAGLDATESMHALTTSMLQFGVDLSNPEKASEEMASMMNVLAAASKEGASEVPEVAAALEVSGAIAKSSGLSFEETAASIEVLAIAGLRGAEGGTKLRGILANLQKITPQAAKDLAKMGISASDLGETLTSQGLNAAMKQLKTGLDQVKNPAEKNAILLQLFGKQNAVAAQTILENSNTMEKFTERLTGTNTAVDQAATKMASFDEVLNRVKAQFQDVALEVGNALIPVLSDIATAIVPVIKSIADNILPPILNIIKVISPLIQSVFGMLSKGLGQILGLLAPVIGEIIGALKPALEKILPPIISILTTIVRMLTPILALVAPLIDLFASLLEPILDLVDVVLKALEPAFVAIAEPIGALIEVFQEMSDEVLPVLIDMLKMLIPLMANGLVVVIKIVAKVLTAWFKIVKFGISIIGSLYKALASVAKFIKDSVVGTFNKLKKAVSSLLSPFSSLLDKLGSSPDKVKPLKKEIEKTAEKTKELTEETKELTTETKDLTDELDDTTDATNDLGGGLDNTGQKMSAFQKLTSELSDKIKTQRERLALLRISNKENTQEYQNLATELTANQALLKGYNDALKKVDETTKEAKKSGSDLRKELSVLLMQGGLSAEIFDKYEESINKAESAERRQAEALKQVNEQLRIKLGLEGQGTSEKGEPVDDSMLPKDVPDYSPLIDDISGLENAGATAMDTIEEMGIVYGQTLVSAGIEGKKAGKLALSAAFDVLQSMVPILTAQIFGITSASPANIATLGVWGATQFVVLTGALQGLVALAKSAAGLQEGGKVKKSGNSKPGPRDIIPAMLEPDEHVTKAKQAKKYGTMLEAINNNDTLKLQNEAAKLLHGTGDIDNRVLIVDQSGALKSIESGNTKSNRLLHEINEKLDHSALIRSERRHEIKVVQKIENKIKSDNYLM